MRSVELSSKWDVPKYERQWLSLADKFHAIWAASKRKPFSGRVRVSYLWETRTPKTLEEEAEIAVELISHLDFMLNNGASPHIGNARCEVAPEPKLLLTLEGE